MEEGFGSELLKIAQEISQKTTICQVKHREALTFEIFSLLLVYFLHQ